MEVLTNKTELEHYVQQQKEKGKTIGFAPTMGALHKGHLSLYEMARKENDVVISSIFVNPTQFNNAEDLEKYPRTIDQDIALLRESQLVDAVYTPSVEDIYPEQTKSETYDFGGIENEMEGKFRPGHFDGVGTVVEALLRQTQPDNAYFGEKDYQQLAIIRKLIELKNLNTKIVGVPIYRNEEGLALSSRNARLTETERNQATIIHQTLKRVNEWFRVLTVEEIKNRVAAIFDKEDNMTLEYFLIADEETLKETNFFYKDKNYRAFIVVYVGDVRLIDNMHLD